MILGIDASRANVKEKTGTERYSWEVIRRLPALLPDVKIRLYSREPLEESLQHLGPNVESVVLDWAPGVLWSHIRLAWELMIRPPDVLFVTADTVPLFHPKKTITTIHDVAFERFPELYRGKSVQRKLGWLRPILHLAVRIVTLGQYSASERDYHRWSVRHAIRSCSHLFTVSEFSKAEIVSLLHADPQRISVTHLGVRQASFFSAISAEEKQAVQKTFSLPPQFFLFLGRLETKKNIDGLLAGYQVYCHQSPSPIPLVLVGNPGYGWEQAWEKVPEGLRHHILRLGFVSDPQVAAIQTLATACIMISRYEGFGIPPVESLAAGVPVVASRWGSLPEVLGPAARFVAGDKPEDVAAGLDSVVRDVHLRNELVSQGKRWVQQFEWDTTASKTADILRPFLNLQTGQKNGTV